MKISSELRDRILRQLDDSLLVRSGFTCKFDARDDTLVEINSSGHPHLRFSIRSSPNSVDGDGWESLESPGPLFRGAETSRFEPGMGHLLFAVYALIAGFAASRSGSGWFPRFAADEMLLI